MDRRDWSTRWITSSEAYFVSRPASSRRSTRRGFARTWNRSSGTSNPAKAPNLRNNGLGFDLDLPSLVEQRLDDDHRGGRPGGAHRFAVGASHRRAIFGVSDEHSIRHDLIRRRADLGQRGGDDLEAALRLHVGVRVDRSVGPDRSRARDEDAVAETDGAAESDRFLVRRPRADPCSRGQGLRNGSSSSCSNRSWTAVRSSATSSLTRSCDELSVTFATRIRRNVVCSAYSPAASLAVMRAAAPRRSRAASWCPWARSQLASRAAATSTRCVFGFRAGVATSRDRRGSISAWRPWGRFKDLRRLITLLGPIMTRIPAAIRRMTTNPTSACSTFT